MIRFWHRVIFIGLCLLWIAPGYTQDMKKLGQSGMTWLTIDPSARGAAMGSVLDWSKGDPNGVFYNPASLAAIEGGAFSANYSQWIADMNKYDLAFAYNFNGWGTFGLAIQSMDYGDVYGTVIAHNDQGYEDTGFLDVGAYSVGIAYSRSLTDKFSLGGVIKYVDQKLGNNNYYSAGELVEENKANQVSAASFDFGTMYDTGIKSLRVTMSIRNFSGQLLYEGDEFTLPLLYKIGLSMDLIDFFPSFADHISGWHVVVEGVDSRDRPDHVNAGTEMGFKETLYIRAGYSSREGGYSEEGGLGAGLGLKFKSGNMRFCLDYGYNTFSSALGNTNRFTLTGYF